VEFDTVYFNNIPTYRTIRGLSKSRKRSAKARGKLFQILEMGYFSPKCRDLSNLHEVITQTTVLFVVMAVRTPNYTIVGKNEY
jgi:hypothetical protein